MRCCHCQSHLAALGPGGGCRRVTSLGVRCWEQEIRQRQPKPGWGWGGRAEGSEGLVSQRECLQAGSTAGRHCLLAPMALEAAMCSGRRDAEGEEMRVPRARSSRASCLHLPAPGMHPSGCSRVILGAELLQGGVAKRRVVL